MSFFQEGPRLGNQYETDALLKSYLMRVLPEAVRKQIEPGLKKLGERTVTDIQALGDAAEGEPPRHIPYDPWGRRIDKIQVSHAWKELGRIATEEKLVGIAYERQHGPLSRLHQFARIYLFAPASAIYTCPLAMTDGAARALELYGDDEQRNEAFMRLTSSHPGKAWTSGQWMTEKTGGSDVSGTSTVARKENGQFRLYGTKWFTSATTSEMAITLARIEGAEAGSKGLSLFYVKLRDDEGVLNNIHIHRLKDKLGTKALPTAELTLNGTFAELVGEEGNGVKKIASLFNITRVWNACVAVSFMRRGIALAKDYATKRVAFGRPLIQHPLHRETLANLETEFQGAFLLVFRLAELLGKDELKVASKQESLLLRLLTPLAKLYTAKQGVGILSEVVEAFGGAGYVEDSGIPRLLRDAQVLSIWEGTTNVLSLDTLRAIQKENALDPFFKEIEEKCGGIKTAELSPLVAMVRDAVKQIAAWFKNISKDEELQASARALAFSLTRTYTAILLIEHAEWEKRQAGEAVTAAAARRWCSRELCLLNSFKADRFTDSTILTGS